jgi:hypothetical protein
MERKEKEAVADGISGNSGCGSPSGSRFGSFVSFAGSVTTSKRVWSGKRGEAGVGGGDGGERSTI